MSLRIQCYVFYVAINIALAKGVCFVATVKHQGGKET